MRSLLVVGGDHLGNITDQLKALGVCHICHLSGRKCQQVKREIPKNIDAVLVLTDYINHNLSKVIKQRAKEQKVPIYFAKRSWCSIYKCLTEGDPERFATHTKQKTPTH
ncbi:Uncharacterized conserved protein UCP020408 [Caldalkalibacillus thermarum TA2.A1]|uniref:DUF2325 domain-containing protein n=1 Tax=Caldalkalibacillus thermarum (strain TA2.A1) TaxID=986075 RepID=F5L6P9_CALTT|nr:DUF2325 domain-containing protein [Caldalkalibacillus thermarum]EGL83000.1 Uncharacterized conserved protein UCP020408 [Caldalkalibacillus thermarum TA2.A1]QZT34594.1 DUF2325 domain-containing protein [Caldalkalibacillus thermarum TA2.A1]GGK26633.1 dihydroorotate dehydrogenase [Caldalkalibacillus thermarum]